MQQLVLRGSTVAWPNACACCLTPATERVPVQSTSSTHLVVATYRKTLTLQIPYCGECAAQVRQRQQMTPWVKALLVFMGIWMGGTLLAALLGNALAEIAPVAILVLMPLSCAAPFVGAGLYISKARRSRLAPLPAPHVCASADAVGIVGFEKDSVTVSVSRDEYAAALRTANPAAG